MHNRREFLAAGAGAALIPAVTAAAAAPTPAPKPSYPPLDFDLAAFDAELNAPVPHKHLFTTTRIEGGLIFGQMRGVVQAYQSIGVAAKDVRPVAVLYHGFPVLLAFDDAIWNEYVLPAARLGAKSVEALKKQIDTVAERTTTGNPCLRKNSNDKEDDSMQGLVADAGARFYACNWATQGMAHIVAGALKKDPLEVYRAMAAHLVPNATLVPAGVWAVHAVQERKYTLLVSGLGSGG